MTYTIHADGGARGNPGPAGAGAVIRDESGTTMPSVPKFLGHQTNNFAEYEAAILAFDELRKRTVPEQTAVVVKMDSELVVKQMKGEYRVKHPNIKGQHARLKDKTEMFQSVSFVHIPRE